VGAIAIIRYGYLFFANTPHPTLVVRVRTEFLIASDFYLKSLSIWKKISFQFLLICLLLCS